VYKAHPLVHIGICNKGFNAVDESKGKQDGEIIFCRDPWGEKNGLFKSLASKLLDLKRIS
jgi:hypothetical protein